MSGKSTPKRARGNAWNSCYLYLDLCRLGSANHFAKHVSERYASHFGPPNQQLHFANHSLVLLDAPGLVNEDYQRAGRGTSFDDWTPLKGGAIEFVKDIAIREFCATGYAIYSLDTNQSLGPSRIFRGPHHIVHPYTAAPVGVAELWPVA